MVALCTSILHCQCCSKLNRRYSVDRAQPLQRRKMLVVVCGVLWLAVAVAVAVVVVDVAALSVVEVASIVVVAVVIVVVVVVVVAASL